MCRLEPPELRSRGEREMYQPARFARRDQSAKLGPMPSASDIATTEARPRVRDALTELHAYVLVLDGELGRVEHRVATLPRSGAEAIEVDDLRRRRTELAAQLELLARMIVALRAAADPAGQLF